MSGYLAERSMALHWRFWIVLAILAANASHAASADDCEREVQPYTGQAGKDVIWVPTPDATVNRMLTMAQVRPDDFVVDLGAGDGKIAIAAARDFGAEALGIEYNPVMVRLAQCKVQAAGVAGRAKVVEGDIFATDFRRATVVTMYLLPSLNLRLRPTLLEMRPGTRVVSHDFGMEDWAPDEHVDDGNGGSVFLWIVPARVEGVWNFRPRRGGRAAAFAVTLSQSFQAISGELEANGARRPLERAVLRGAHLDLDFLDESGQMQRLTGDVKGGAIEATLTDATGDTARYRGLHTGSPAAAAAR